jgi:hypothetical protein
MLLTNSPAAPDPVHARLRLLGNGSDEVRSCRSIAARYRFYLMAMPSLFRHKVV